MSGATRRERGGSAAERAALAAAPDAPPELLTWLAADPVPAVRRAVAANPATPPEAGLLLADDPEMDVREALAGRAGPLAPAAAARDRPGRLAAAILDRLAEDAFEEVRAALADALAALPEAPRALILKLARDRAARVAGPVLRLSPLLAEADLLALVADPPAPATRRLIAARPRLAEAVCEAVAGSADSPAIAALLANPSAAIREATLDRLAAGAAAEPEWQAALLRRPRLPPGAVRALGAILAAHLLDVLAARPDLPQGLVREVKARLAARIAEAAPGEALARDAALAGDRAGLATLLAAVTALPAARIEAALALRSPRAIAALCWRAGWSAGLAEEVQAALGVPRDRLARANAEGGWSLSTGELQWQLGLLEELPA